MGDLPVGELPSEPQLPILPDTEVGSFELAIGVMGAEEFLTSSHPMFAIGIEFKVGIRIDSVKSDVLRAIEHCRILWKREDGEVVDLPWNIFANQSGECFGFWIWKRIRVHHCGDEQAE